MSGPPVLGDAAESEAAEQVAEMAAGIHHCERCRLHEGRTHAVPGEGPVPAELVIIGEGPGGMEDRSGRPFVGPAGHLLDTLLAEQGLERKSIFITNCVKCRPPANRTPRADELSICTRTWLEPQLARLAPRLLVALGQTAVKSLLGPKAKVTALHGTVQARSGPPCFVTFHPAAALRFDSIREALQEDFQILGKVLRGEITPDKPPASGP